LTGNALVETPGSEGGGEGRAGGERAVVLLASNEVDALADAVRLRHDPEWFERVPPHVSLVGPFRPDRSDEEVAARLAGAVAETAPFEARLGDPDVFIVPKLVLFLEIENEAPLRALYERVVAAFPAHRPELEFEPHLTLGRFASQEDLSRALARLREELARRREESGPLGFRVEEVHLFGEDPETGVYRSCGRACLCGSRQAPLGGRGEKGGGR
jgi:2'-5' RNA ligase